MQAGDPVQVLSSIGHTWRKLRCEQCAGPAPYLPPLPEPPSNTIHPTVKQPRVRQFTRLNEVAQNTKWTDWKLKQAKG